MAIANYRFADALSTQTAAEYPGFPPPWPFAGPATAVRRTSPPGGAAARGAALGAAVTPARRQYPRAMRTRPAEPADVHAIHELVLELAGHVGHRELVVSTAADFAAALFPESGQPRVFCQVAEADGPDGPRVVGHAVWFVTFSTWTGGYGIWLEDLVVTGEHRGNGVGRALIRDLARICVERGYPRLEWYVDDINDEGKAFYGRLGSEAQTGLTIHRLAGSTLAEVAG